MLTIHTHTYTQTTAAAEGVITTLQMFYQHSHAGSPTLFTPETDVT